MDSEEGTGGTAGAPDGPGALAGPGHQFGCASFNQDSTSLAVGTKTGYKLFSLTSVDKLDCVHDDECPGVLIVERLFSSSLVAVVTAAAPRRMNIVHFKKGTEICNYSYSQDILSLKLNRQRLVVCLQESIYIHNIKDMKLFKTLLNTTHNPTGLCALSISASSYLAFPGSSSAGDIQLYDANNLSELPMISAHDSPVAALSFSASSTRLASASERGTVIRVFSVPEGERLYEFRRGVKRYVSIRSLSFSPDGQFLCASSNTETVHIFKVEPAGASGGGEEAAAATWTSLVLSAASSLLPSQVSGMMSQDRAFATVHLPESDRRNICTLATIQKVPRVLVASACGHLLTYTLDPVDGGECTLAHKHSLFGVGGAVDPQTEASQSEGSEVAAPAPAFPSYAATAALPAAGPVSATLTGYCEDGGAKKGEVIPEHELAAGPVSLEDENEFPPINWRHDGTGGGAPRRL